MIEIFYIGAAGRPFLGVPSPPPFPDLFLIPLRSREMIDSFPFLDGGTSCLDEAGAINETLCLLSHPGLISIIGDVVQVRPTFLSASSLLISDAFFP